jgi:hypothetical protein
MSYLGMLFFWLSLYFNRFKLTVPILGTILEQAMFFGTEGIQSLLQNLYESQTQKSLTQSRLAARVSLGLFSFPNGVWECLKLSSALECWVVQLFRRANAYNPFKPLFCGVQSFSFGTVPKAKA